MNGTVIIFISFAYLGLLFAIAYFADKRADAGRSVIASPYVYSLSLAVYATAWTFYGSVGRAASDGIGFLPIYIGPDADDRAVVDRHAQDRAHLQIEPHHFACRFHRLAVWQKRAARRARHRHRGDRHPALHFAAVEGDIE
jgi:hypothetical protein